MNSLHLKECPRQAALADDCPERAEIHFAMQGDVKAAPVFEQGAERVDVRS